MAKKAKIYFLKNEIADFSAIYSPSLSIRA